jgi:cellulose synthase/poly-beta-1,6-N-acetylglucosamine synthase-like glycosyltransferase
MSVVFLAALAVLVYAYAGYPFSLWLLRPILGRRPRPAAGAALPSVTLVISAYNEEHVMQEKVENALALDYPPGLLRILVVSDGSTDATDALVARFADRGVGLRSFPERRGKVACLNEVVPTLTTDLVVLSDANSMYRPDSVKRLATTFADPRVGCVCGELLYDNPRSLASGEGEKVYWGYERGIKRLESALGSLLGANGAIYAFRTRLFRSVDPLMFCDDVIPIRIRLDGFLAFYEPGARCVEEAVAETVEARRRRRHASFGLRTMLRMGREALAAGRILVLYQCVAHRILRWLGGLCLIAMVLSSPFLASPWNAVAPASLALFGGAALAGWLLDRAGRRVTILYLPYYFLVITSAGVRGLGAWLSGTDHPYWEPRK